MNPYRAGSSGRTSIWLHYSKRTLNLSAANTTTSLIRIFCLSRLPTGADPLKKVHRHPILPSQKPLNSGYSRHTFLTLAISLLLLASVALFWLQHTGRLSGGAIAPSKLAWLTTVLVYWYILPVYWLRISTQPNVQLACQLFLLSMSLRAVIELYMMYISKNWLHIYGIGHDIFSVAICVIFSISLVSIHRTIALYFLFCSFLFAVETLFALYLRSVSKGDGSVFFLEAAPEHNTVLWLTRFAVMVSIAVFCYLVRRNSRATA